MSELKVIGSEDTQAASEIVAASYELLHTMELVELSEPEVKTPEVIGVSGVCVEVSDAVTRAAHHLGIVASRECHDGHFFTSFTSLDASPGEEDPILCLSWGQFQPVNYDRHSGEFFGKRRDICPLVGGYYEGFYASWTTEWRQTVHTPISTADEHPGYSETGHTWLITTPEDIASREFPVGEVPRSDFPADMWEPEVVPPSLT
jgi:hypothetical protein